MLDLEKIQKGDLIIINPKGRGSKINDGIEFYIKEDLSNIGVVVDIQVEHKEVDYHEKDIFDYYTFAVKTLNGSTVDYSEELYFIDSLSYYIGLIDKEINIQRIRINKFIDIKDKLYNLLPKCNHKDKDNQSTIEYCSSYEMRSSDMYCTQCNEHGTRAELESK